MSPKWKLALLSLLSIFVLTGCWNSRELNDMALVIAIGVDKKEEKYIFTAQVINPSMVAGQGGGLARSPIMSYKAEGDSLFEAWRKLTKNAPRKMYFSHVRIVVIGEKLAREGIYDLLDPILRDHEFRTDYYILVAREEKAENVLSVLTSLEEIPAFKIDKMLKAATDNLGVASYYTLDTIVNDLKGTGKEPVLSSVRIEGRIEDGQTLSNLEGSRLKTRVILDELAVLKEGKVVGFLGDEDSRGYNYSQGNIKSAVEKLTCLKKKEKIMIVEIIRTKSKIKAELKNGKPFVTIHVKVEGNIVDVACEAKPQEEKVFKKYEKQLNEHIQSMIENVVTITQEEFQTDIIGIGEAVHRNEPKYWAKHEKEWLKIFPQTEVKVVVNAKIRNIGSINQPLEVKEK